MQYLLLFALLLKTSSAGYNGSLETCGAVSPTNVPTTGETPLVVTGGAMGRIDFGIMVSVGLTAAMSTTWISDTSLVAIYTSAGVGTTLGFAISVGQGVCTSYAVVSYDINTLQGVLPAGNGPPSGGFPLTVVGGGFGSNSNYSPFVRTGVTATQSTFWTSDTSVLAFAARGAAGSLAVVVTTGVSVGTGMVSLSYNLPLISSMRTPTQITSGGTSSTLTGSNFGRLHVSQMGRVGRTGSLTTRWVADTALITRPGGGIGATCVVVLTTAQRVGGTSAPVFSYILPVSSSILNQNRPTSLKGNTITASGTGFGRSRFSMKIRIGGSATEVSEWHSDTSVYARNAYGVGGTLSLATTVSVRVGTILFAMSFNAPALSSPSAGNVPKTGGGLFTLIGSGFGAGVFVPTFTQQAVFYSPQVRVGGSTVLTTIWTADTFMVCTRSAPGTSIGLTVAVTSGVRVGCKAQLVSYDTAVLASTHSPRRLIGTGCAILGGVCTCTGGVIVPTVKGGNLNSVTGVQQSPFTCNTEVCYCFPLAAAPAITSSAAVTVLGQNFGSSQYSSQMQIYQSAAWQSIATTWLSDSSIVAQFPTCTGCSVTARSEQIQFVSGPVFNLQEFTYVLCTPGQYFLFGTGASGSCVNCNAGSYSPATDSTICTFCEAGTYGTGTAASSCTLCAPGTYSVGSGVSTAATCTACGAGTYSTGSGSPVTCMSCDAGTYYTGVGTVICDKCASGTYSTVLGATRAEICINCAAGAYSTASGAGVAEVCVKCSAGTYSTVLGANVSEICTKCVAGTYSTALGANVSDPCIRCVAGTYSTVLGATVSGACTNCGAGTYSAVLGAAVSATCTNCVAGTYSTVLGAAVSGNCTTCGAGTYSTTLGATVAGTCTNCRAGTYSIVVGAIASGQCINCGTGTYSTVLGATAAATCLNCSAGAYFTGVGAPTKATCSACGAGTYSAVEAATSSAVCIRCPAGSYSAAKVATSALTCIKCSAGYYSTTVGAIGSRACVSCGGGTYSTGTGFSACFGCAAGTFSTLQGGTSMDSCTPCTSGGFSTALGLTSNSI